MSRTGIVKSFNGASGYGFISCDGKDLFVHQHDCTGVPEKDDEVKFDIEPSPSKEGQFVAKNVVCSGGLSCQGVVKSFSQASGYGFIDHNGQDVFVHIRNCGGGTAPDRGDMVNFDVVPNPQKPEQPMAVKCTGGTAAIKGKGELEKGKGKGKGDDWGKGKGWDAWGAPPAWGKGDGWGKGAFDGAWGPYGKGKFEGGWVCKGGFDDGWGKGKAGAWGKGKDPWGKGW